MAFPTTDRHKILETQFAEAPYNWDRGLPIKDTTFHGVVAGVVIDSEQTFAYLQVVPFPPSDPDTAGDLKFETLGTDPADSIPDNARYVKVYALNLPVAAVQAYYQEGDI